MKQHEDILARIREFQARQDLSQAKLARLLGVDPSNFSKLLNGQLPVTNNFINRMVVELGVSKEWLVNGQGVMMADSLPAKHLGTPVYDIDITAGARALSRELTDERLIGFMALPDVSPNCIIVRVSGDSMTPEVSDGSLIAVREVPVAPPFFWGQMYVVVLDDYRMVKFLRKNREEPDSVVLHSANPAYDDIDVSLRDIRKLLFVETVIDIKRRY